MASGLAMSVCMQKAMASMRVGWGRGQVAPNTATAGRTAARGVVKETKAYMLWMGGRGVALGKRPCSVNAEHAFSPNHSTNQNSHCAPPEGPRHVHAPPFLLGEPGQGPFPPRLSPPGSWQGQKA